MHNFFRDEPPITGGNAWEIKKELEVQTEKNKINFGMAINDTNKKVSEMFAATTFDEWRLLNYQADYWANLFAINCGSNSLKKKILLVIRISFFYGKAGLLKWGDTYIPCYIVDYKTSPSGKLEEVIAASAHGLLSQGAEIPKVSKRFRLVGPDLDNFCLLFWDTWAMSAWYKFMPFIKQQKKLLEMINTESYTMIKKFEYTIADPGAIDTELEAFFNTQNPFNKRADASIDIGNRITTIDTGDKNIQPVTINFYNQWLEVQYSLQGRRLNTDRKKERNIKSEISASQSNFSVLEYDHYSQLFTFCSQLSRISGLDIFIINDLDEEKIYDMRNIEEGDSDV